MLQLITRLKSFVDKNELFDFDDKLLVAVSGGIDSTTLLDILVKAGFKVAIAHCNFGLRGEESDGDERFVRSLQEKYGIKGYYIRFDTENEANLAKESIQMAARRLRYSWFNTLCNEKNYRYIAIAHNADDVSETFFLNLSRGTGLKGLTGIKPKTGRVVRPLLFANRSEIEHYAKESELHSREDSSNAKDKYSRNRIRLNVIPELKKINPAFNHTMLENISRLLMVEDLVNQEVNNFKRDAITFDNEIQKISIRKLKFNRNARLILFEYLSFYGFNSSQINSILISVEAGDSGSRFFGRDHILLRDRDDLVLYPISTEGKDEVYYIYEDMQEVKKPVPITVEHTENSSSFSLDRSSSIALIDSAKIEFPIIIRKWQKGDEFQPLGLKGRKKLSDFFIDQKMTIYEKESQWLLCTSNDIIWVMGKRLDDRYKITDQTRTILKISIQEE